MLTNATARKGGRILLETAFDSFKEIFHTSMSLDEIVKNFSPKLKKIIQNYQEDEGTEFQVGRIKIIYLDEQSFALNCELYFKDSEGKWLQFSRTSEMDSTEWLSPDSQIALRHIQEKIFSVTINDEKIEIVEK